MSAKVKIIAGVAHVWDIFENDWVTEAYWEYVNGRSTVDPAVRSCNTNRKEIAC